MRVAVTCPGYEWAAVGADHAVKLDEPCVTWRRSGIAVATADLEQVTDDVLIVPRAQRPEDGRMVARRRATNRIAVFCDGPCVVEARSDDPHYGPVAAVQELREGQ